MYVIAQTSFCHRTVIKSVNSNFSVAMGYMVYSPHCVPKLLWITNNASTTKNHYKLHENILLVFVKSNGLSLVFGLMTEKCFSRTLVCEFGALYHHKGECVFTFNVSKVYRSFGLVTECCDMFVFYHVLENKVETGKWYL